MNETWAVWIDGIQKYAGSEELCRAVAANHNALYAGTRYTGPEGPKVIGKAVVIYLGD